MQAPQSGNEPPMSSQQGYSQGRGCALLIVDDPVVVKGKGYLEPIVEPCEIFLIQFPQQRPLHNWGAFPERPEAIGSFTGPRSKATFGHEASRDPT